MKDLVQGMNNKALATVGGVGAVSYVTTRHFASTWFQDDDGNDQENANYMRAAACAALGIGAGYMLRKKAPNVAKGLAVGGVVAGGVYLAEEWELDEKLSEWFDDNDSDTASTDTPSAGVYGIRRRAM